MSTDGPYEILDDRFRTGRCANGDNRLEVLYDGCRWAEGPLYLPAWRQLVWSDIPNDRILRWDEATGSVGVFRAPAGHSNGNTLDRQGRLVTCEQGNRRVTRTEPDGRVTVLAERFDGRRLNSPNDSVVRSDGTIWFSDPDFGITSDYEGHRAESEIGACNVYRIDPVSGQVRLAADGFDGPNGVILTPDERRLFVSDSRAARIHAFDIREDGTLSDGKVFAEGRGTCTSTTSASTTRAACGPPPCTTVSTATTPTARSSAVCACPSPSPTSPSAAPRTTACSSRPPRPCTPW